MWKRNGRLVSGKWASRNRRLTSERQKGIWALRKEKGEGKVTLHDKDKTALLDVKGEVFWIQMTFVEFFRSVRSASKGTQQKDYSLNNIFWKCSRML